MSDEDKVVNDDATDDEEIEVVAHSEEELPCTGFCIGHAAED